MILRDIIGVDDFESIEVYFVNIKWRMCILQGECWEDIGNKGSNKLRISIRIIEENRRLRIGIPELFLRRKSMKRDLMVGGKQ